MPEFATTPPIPYVNIGDQAAAVRSLINVYSKLETYSQAEVDAFFFNRAPDADVTAYIAAIETALTTTIEAALPSAVNPKHKIYNFVTAEKAAGRWGLHKRIYLPIYNNTAASAIDLVSRLSGTFTGLGSVTHAPGYVQGNGTSGYFDFNVTPSALALTQSSGMVFALHKTAPSGTAEKVSVSSIDGSDVTKAIDLNFRSTDIHFSYNAATTGSGAIDATLARTSQNGIIIGSRQGGNRSVFRRNSSAFTNLITQAGGDFGTVPTTKTFAAMRSQYGAGLAYSDVQMGAYGAGLGLTEAQANGFSANLKTLYEALTGITLP